ncbi:hypothetical protein J2Z75_004884 [Rhizobium herbae]|uniref:Uncharacterized protein n=1 Tax=Rhizobium herbae TaxID=508661 RepID=A0ABS4ETS0_9HYPH|nr:hypothetical protein [Rhizobium herbae]
MTGFETGETHPPSVGDADISPSRGEITTSLETL